MYTLRSLTSEGHESNIALGNNYTFIPRKYAEEAFKRVYQNAYESTGKSFQEIPNKECYGMIQSENVNFIFLWESEKNFIMTENGKTFSNLTHK